MPSSRPARFARPASGGSRSMSTARSSRRACRSRGRSGGTIPIAARCRATTRSRPTRRRAGRCCGCRIGRATSTTGELACRFCARCSTRCGRRSAAATRSNSAWMAPFSGATPGLARARRGRVRDQGPLLPVGRAAGEGPPDAHVDAGDRPRELRRACGRGRDLGRQCFRVVVYRTHVEHATAKNFQLDLFDPSDGHYEYSAVVTNKAIGGPALWAFMCGAACTRRCTGS